MIELHIAGARKIAIAINKIIAVSENRLPSETPTRIFVAAENDHLIFDVCEEYANVKKMLAALKESLT